MKSKFIFFLIIFHLFYNHLLSQEYIIVIKNDNSEYSYINLSGQKLIESNFYKCLDFSKYGSAIVKRTINSRYTILDIYGNNVEIEVLLRPISNEWIESVSGFSDGMVRTIDNDKIGAVQYTGELTVPAIYDKLSEFNENHATGLISKTYYVVNRNGTSIAVDYEKIKKIKAFSEGLAPILQGKLYGYIDTLGIIAIPPRFKSTGGFHNGLAWAKDINGLLGYIDKKGNWVIEPRYLAGQHYDKQSDLARVKSINGWGYVNTENQFSDFNITGIFYSFYEGLALKRVNDKLGYIDNKDNWQIQPIYDVAHRFKNGFARVEIDDKWGLIDKNGNWIIEPQYLEIGDVVIIQKQN